MNNWKERLILGGMSAQASLAVWALVMLALLLLAMTLYATVAGTYTYEDTSFSF